MKKKQLVTAALLSASVGFGAQSIFAQTSPGDDGTEQSVAERPNGA